MGAPMARTDWIALVTEPAAEYLAATELSRFGVTVYLPQLRRRWLNPHGGAALTRFHPLFPRYLLAPVQESRSPALRCARGVRRIKPILADEEGRPRLVPGHVIAAIKEAEARGMYDEIVAKGDSMKFAHGVLASISAVMESSKGNTVQLLLPLFGGSRASVASSKVVRA
jgi:hypothetical protein